MKYELMLVTSNDNGDQLLGRVEKYLKEAEVEDLKVERLGRKTLAYVIKKQDTASYYLLNFDGEGKVIKEITDKLRLEQEDLLRYLLVRKIEKKSTKRKTGKVQDEKVEEKEKPKPKVTVAVKHTSAVKSTSSTKKRSTSSIVKKS